MNDRLTTRNLADILSLQTGMVKERAEKFINALSLYITQGIEKNKAVKISGLGTFKVVLVRERESIHIHTGERFVIPAHHKLSFIPDKNLKEHINRPFAFFEPIEATEEIYYSLSSNDHIADDNDENDIEYEFDDHRVETVKPAVTFSDDDFLYSDDNTEQYIPEIPEEQPIVEMEDRTIPEIDEMPLETAGGAIHYNKYDYDDGTDMRRKENEVIPSVPVIPVYLNTEDHNANYNAEGKSVPESDYIPNNGHEKIKTRKIAAPLWLWFLLLPFLIVAGIGIATYVFLYYNAGTLYNNYNNIASMTNNTTTLPVDRYDADETAP
ncbi:MAG: HU family DNA-binding protein, partial [Tannerella sp.]|nr:HU family DNA-binding protein [Tannerella sp.]